MAGDDCGVLRARRRTVSEGDPQFRERNDLAGSVKGDGDTDLAAAARYDLLEARAPWRRPTRTSASLAAGASLIASRARAYDSTSASAVRSFQLRS